MTASQHNPETRTPTTRATLAAAHHAIHMPAKLHPRSLGSIEAAAGYDERVWLCGAGFGSVRSGLPTNEVEYPEKQIRGQVMSSAVARAAVRTKLMALLRCRVRSAHAFCFAALLAAKQSRLKKPVPTRTDMEARTNSRQSEQSEPIRARQLSFMCVFTICRRV
jgi:hypothetical protein